MGRYNPEGYGNLGIGSFTDSASPLSEAAPAAAASGGSWAPWLMGAQVAAGLADAAHKGRMTDWTNKRDADIEQFSFARKGLPPGLQNLTSTSPTADIMGSALSGYESGKGMELGNSPSDWLKEAFSKKKDVASEDPEMAGFSKINIPEADPEPARARESIDGSIWERINRLNRTA